MNVKRNPCRVLLMALGLVMLLVLAPRVARADTAVSTEAALREAVGKGSAAGTVKLDADVTLSGTLDLAMCPQATTSDRTVTINLAGHKIAFSPRVEDKPVVVVPSGFTFVLLDGNGKNAGSVAGGSRGVENHGMFTLKSGGIRNNRGSCDGNGVYNDTGATFTMTGGIIENNTSKGRHGGAGVYNCGKASVTGGIIQNNMTETLYDSNGFGGGIYNGAAGNLALSGGTIQNNSAEFGGGVYNDPACEVMALMGRAKIQSNTATRQGGGIYNGKASGANKLAMMGGIVTNNTAGLEGGGIANAGVMSSSAVSITGNKAGGQGGGIYDEGELTLSGTPIIKDNVGSRGNANDVYLTRDKRITIEDAFTARAQVGIVCEDPHQVFTRNYYGPGYDSSQEQTFFFANPNGDQKDTRIMPAKDDDAGELRCVVVIHYRGPEGGDYERIEYNDVTSDRWGDWGQETWWVVREDTKIDDYIGVRGDVNLILCTGKTLRTDNISVRRNDDENRTRAKFTIWNSVGGDGYLIADGRGRNNAGIGFQANSGGVGSIIINGGNIVAYGGGDAAGIGGVENRGNGPITINNGHVVAYGGDWGSKGGEWGAGIGGGQGGDQDNPIKILGGYVEAYGGENAAGIGGGDSDNGGADGGETIIKNATVYAYGGDEAAGIGGGEDGDGGNVTIENSKVYAKGGDQGAGIGGGHSGDYGGKLTVQSGNVTAVGGKYAAAIGGGECCCGPDFEALGGTIEAFSGSGCETAIGAGDDDHHEGNKSFYNMAKVTAGASSSAGPLLTNDRNRLLQNGAKAWKYNYMKIEPCDHAGQFTCAQKNPADPRYHTVSGTCAYCGLSQGSGYDEPHKFTNHKCACGHVEDCVQLKRDDGSAAYQTDYKSRGLGYTLPSISSTTVGKVFVGWSVTGLSDQSANKVYKAGETFVVAAAGSESQTITAVAQWAEIHVHGLVKHEPHAATCTEDGNVAYWACEEGDEPCGKCFSDAEGTTEAAPSSVVIPAFGHKWGAPEYAWSDDHTACTATHTCENDSSHTETKTAVVMPSVTVPATCTQEGQTYNLAIFPMSTEFKTQRYVTASTPALGHQWGVVTYTWSADNSTCTAKRTCTRKLHEEDEQYVCNAEETETVEAGVASTSATCTDSGVVTYTAEFANPDFVTQTKWVQGGNPLGHDWGDPVYTWSQDLETCTATRTCKNDPSHTESVDSIAVLPIPTKIPTCTEPGSMNYLAVFGDKKTYETQVKTVAIAATGHKWGERTTVKEPGTTEPGEEQRTCEKCGEVETRSIPVTGHIHKLEHVEAKDPTCATAGNTEYWHCKDKTCDRYFSDDTGAVDKEIEHSATVRSALGHAWGEARYKWNDDNTAVSAMCFCTRNPLHFQIEAVYTTSRVIAEPTCTEPGQTRYTAIFTKEGFDQQSKTVATDALGHDWGAWTQTKAPTCTEPGTETSTCSRCSEEGTREVAALGHSWGAWTVTKPATTTEDGVETHSCTRCDATETRAIPKVTHAHGMTMVDAEAATCDAAGHIAYWVCDKGDAPCGHLFADPLGQKALSEKDVVVPPLGHDWGKPTYEWSDDNATCTAIRVCTHDASHVETEVASASATVKEAATCTKGGQVRYEASFKNKAFAAQTKTAYTAPNGHTPAPNPRRENVTAPSCTAGGSYDAAAYCLTCKETLATMHIDMPPLGHDWDEWNISREPTCTGAGEESRACMRDGCTVAETQEVPALGHEWDEWRVTKEATETEQGVEQRECWACHTTETRIIPKTGHEHSFDSSSHVAAEDATCTKDGNKEYWRCTGGDEPCERYFVRTEDETAGPTVKVDGQTVHLKEENFEEIVISSLGHDWDEGTETTPPTCVLEGVRTYTCTRCSETKTEPIDPVGHYFAVTTEPTFLQPSCVAPGYAWRVVSCNKCGAEVSRVLVRTDPLGHDWGAWTVSTEATESGEGLMERVCTRDSSHREVLGIPKLNHDWGEPAYTWSADLGSCTAKRVCKLNAGHVETQDAKSIAVVESFPTCVDAGRTIYTAWFGNAAFLPQTKAVETDPLGHQWGDWTVTKPATETEEGEGTRTCGRCGMMETRTIPKIVPDVVTYRCISVEVSWTQGSAEPAVFTFKRNADDELTFSHFTGVTVDDKALEASAYDAVAGSVVLTLKPEYLNTLDEGKHTVKALFDDGDPAEATLVVRPAEEEGKEENKEEGKEENKEEGKEENKEEGKEEGKEENKEEGKKGSEKKSGGETSPTDGTPSASGASNVSNVSGTSSISTTTSNASTRTPATADATPSLAIVLLLAALGATACVAAFLCRAKRNTPLV